MPLQPAHEVLLQHDDHAITLRASLRAAVAIDNMPGGIPETWDQISRQSYTAIRGVILASATDRLEAEKLLATAAGRPLALFLPLAQAACLAVIAALLATGDDAETQSQGSKQDAGAAMPLRTYYKTLFGYATGWLGWTPAETWQASPQEIEAAFIAHIDRMVTMTPGLSRDEEKQTSKTQHTPERLREIEAQGLDPEFDRQGLRELQAMMG